MQLYASRNIQFFTYNYYFELFVKEVVRVSYIIKKNYITRYWTNIISDYNHGHVIRELRP
jgi:hypothetical protein